jgi:hypothetical protein
VIGHALTVEHRPVARAHWDRLIATGFAIGSACFFIGPFPGFVQLVGSGADGAVFFTGSVFFTLAAGLELLFNVNTFDALNEALSTEQQNRLVFAPDLIGSACFLCSGVLAYSSAP